MKNVLIIAPEFVPANSAAVNRSRFFAMHLPSLGWSPTVLTIKEKWICGPLDPLLYKLLPSDLEVIRLDAMPPGLTNDLGLRCLGSFQKATDEICRQRKIDLIFIPGPPWFMFCLGPKILKKYRVPFVIDYIDPWISPVSARASFFSKAGIFHQLASFFEGRVLKKASAVTAVSEGILEDLKQKYSFLSQKNCQAMPYGSDPLDFKKLEELAVHPPDFKEGDALNICFTGAIQPTSFEMLSAFFSAVRSLEAKEPALYAKIKIRFYGTSNLTWGHDRFQVTSRAAQFGLGEKVVEIPQRISYLESLAVQKASSINIVMGSSEKYYHASKLYACLLAKKPMLAFCHAQSSIVQVFGNLGIESIVTFNNSDEILNKVEAIASTIQKIFHKHCISAPSGNESIDAYSAYSATKVLSRVFDQVITERH